ncbi:MAG: hypothetical protein JF621_13495 [Streptomyces turgidiscabies]|nr:hypothetical protein [Streptomyces turgidiscabies]
MQNGTSRRAFARAIAALGTATILTWTAGAATAIAETGIERSGQTTTPAVYIRYLSSPKFANDEAAARTLSEFKGLSAAGKEKYLDYLNDPKVLEALILATSEAEPGSDPAAAPTARATAVEESTSSFNGDVVVVAEQEATFTPDAAAGAQARGKLSRGTWETKYSHSQKILGVTVTRLSVWVNYYTNGSKITRVNFAECGKRNFNAAVAISSSVPKHWLDGSYANGSVVWEGSIIYKGFGVSIDKRQQVWANESGFRGGYLKNL